MVMRLMVVAMEDLFVSSTGSAALTCNNGHKLRLLQLLSSPL